MVSTLGIDLSADPRQTAACSITWPAGRQGRVDRLLLGSREGDGLDNDRLTRLIDASDLSGIDAPFGWPVAFVAAVRRWRDSEGWAAGPDVSRLRYRETDLRLPGGRRPLSVSSDLIGVTAMRCASILDALGPAVDRSGLSGPVIEIYPAAALKSWDFVSSGYKGRSRSDVRGRLVADLRDRLDGICEIGDDSIRLCEHSDDAFDSLVASLVVRARMLGLTGLPEGPEQLEAARTEGWIHVPDCRLGELKG